jgi:chromate transporter
MSLAAARYAPLSAPMQGNVPFPAFLKLWAKVGCLSFGGPAGQIALMHRLLVDEKKWLDEATFLRALNFCMLLPGPEAQQLATYAGWRLHGVRGGLAAGLLFILPGVAVMAALALAYLAFGHLTAAEGLLLGVKAVVLAIVVEALFRVAKRALKVPAAWWIAAAAFVALFLFDVPFPLVVIAAGVVGAALLPKQPVADGPPAVVPGIGRSVRTLGTGLAFWFAPVALVALLLGSGHRLVDLGLFFSKMAVVTFGGAYAALAWVAQAAVEDFGWLAATEMVDGLGLAETTPGPLVLVMQFVGMLAGARDALPFEPWVAALLGGAMVVWVTFAPCFLWIFLGAPWIDRLERAPRLSAALGGITAAVVGVILNLALWFALHVLFAVVGETHIGPLRLWVPDVATIDWRALAIAVAAMVAMFRFHAGLIPTLIAGAVAGLVLTLI